MADPATRGAVLLAIARESIGEALGLARLRERADGWIATPAATFVTLHLGGELRGCIGSIEAHRPLGTDVAANARAAAFSDSRFLPVTPAEYAALCVEVSVLSPRAPLAAATEAQALAALRPGIDGLCLEYRGSTATFLPQVWEKLADPAEFLRALRLKARLPAGFWDPAIRLSRYTVEKHADEHARA